MSQRADELSEYIGEEGTSRIFKRNEDGDYVELCPHCYDLTVWPPRLRRNVEGYLH